MRKITVFSQSGNSRTSVNSSATTWGELLDSQPDIAAHVNSDVKIMIRETKTAIESRDSILPDTDLNIYLSATKVKSGLTEEQVIIESENIATDLTEAVLTDIEAMSK